MLRIVFTSPMLAIGEWRCEERCGPARRSESVDDPEIVFIRRGVFTARFGSESFVASPAHALVLPPRVAYRIDHPTHDGDDCTFYRLTAEGREALEREGIALFDAPRLVPLSARIAREVQDEEAAWSVVDSFASEADCAPRHGLSLTARRAVDRAAELIAVRFTESLPLAVVARDAGVSPFHLMRAFRRVHGMTMHRYQQTIRLRAALDRLSAGFHDLTALALDLGFSDHSHFTRAFRAEFGVTPSEYRFTSSHAGRARR